MKTTNTMKTVRSITAKTFKTDLRDAPYYRVYGIATSAEPKETKYGEVLLFRGHFEAVFLETGETVQSKQLYLPGPIEGELNAKRLEAGGVVEFSYEIERTTDEDSVVGYFYTWKDLNAESDIDVEAVMANLRGST